jgi:hypothetical protein
MSRIKGNKVRLQDMKWDEVEEEKELCMVSAGEKGEEGELIKMSFQVAQVKKPLVAVKRIVEKGNYVCFGPEEGDNYIKNKNPVHSP